MKYKMNDLIYFAIGMLCTDYGKKAPLIMLVEKCQGRIHDSISLCDLGVFSGYNVLPT